MAERIPADTEVRVVVAGTFDEARDASDRHPIIALIPERVRRTLDWDDFGRNYFARLWVASPVANAEFHIRFMFAGINRTSPELERLLHLHGPVFPIEALEGDFVSLLPDLESYREILKIVGFDAGISALRKIGDVVVARTEGTDTPRLALAGTEDFHLGVMRASNALTVLRRAGSYFRRAPPPIVDDLATSFTFRATLPSADNLYEIEFDFEPDPVFQDRMAVLIGRNGVGKTQLLKALVDSFIKDEPGDAKHLNRTDPVLAPSRVLVFSAVPTDPFPRTIGAWRGIDYEYFAVNAAKEEGNDTLLSSLIACVRDEGTQGFGPQREQSREDLIKSVLTSLGVWDRLYVPLRPLADGQEQLPGVITVDNQRYLPIRRRLGEQAGLRLLHQLDWSRSPVVLDGAMKPRALSSGEYAMMRFAAQAVASVEQGSLLLLDEPETHLHPNYVSYLVDVLSSILEATGSIAIVATHSAYVVRETPRQRVIIMSIDNRQAEFDQPRMQTFGASIDQISQFVFGDSSMEHRYQRRLVDWTDEIGTELGIDRVIAEHGDQLNSESLSFIARQLRAGR